VGVLQAQGLAVAAGAPEEHGHGEQPQAPGDVAGEVGQADAASSLTLLAQIEAKAGDHLHALRLAGAANHSASTPLERHTAFVTPGPRLDEAILSQVLAEGRNTLGRATADKAFEAGTKLSLWEAVAEAVRGSSRSGEPPTK
jgi:hypothetical protein